MNVTPRSLVRGDDGLRAPARRRRSPSAPTTGRRSAQRGAPRHGQEHRRHAEQERDPVPGDQVERVPPGRTPRRAPRVPPLRNVGSTVWFSAATWNIGAADERHLVAGQVDVEQQVDAVPGDVGVGEHGALGPPGGARRVEDHAGLVAGRPARRARSVDAPASSASYSSPGRRPRRPPGSRPSTVDANAGAHDQHAGAAVGQDVGQFRRGQPPVQRHEHRAELRRWRTASRGTSDGSGPR